MTPRIICYSLLLCLTAGLLPAHAAFAQQEIFPFLGEVTGDRVNVRSGQSANFERLCQLNKGDEVVVVDREFGWYKVQLPKEAHSYVSKKYVQYLGKNAGGIVADRVNIRAGAGLHHTVLGQLDKGEQIYLAEEKGEWYRIEPISDSYAWISDQFVSFKSNDVLEYQSETYSRPFVETDLFGIAEDQVMAEDAGSGIEQEEEIYSAVGYVEKFEDKDEDGIQYKIVENGRTVCYVLGENHMLGRFMHYKVSVEGTVNKKLQAKYVYPVVIVSKVRLML